MNFKYGWMTIVALGLATFFFEHVLHAQTWDGGGDGSSWTDANNWNPNAVPTSSGVVTIGSTFEVILNVSSSATIGTFNISGELTIPAGKTLIVSGSAPAAGLNILDGVIMLQGENSILRFIGMSQDIEGTGRIQGDHNAARLQIADGYTLNNKIHIEGALIIEADDEEGEATLSNEVTSATIIVAVIANKPGGAIIFRPSIVISDTDFIQGGNTIRPKYAALVDGATMEFTRQHPSDTTESLLGDFVAWPLWRDICLHADCLRPTVSVLQLH